MNIVTFLRRFMRSDFGRSYVLRSVDMLCAYTAYRQDGTLKEISEDMVADLHAQWEPTMNRVAAIRARMPRQLFGKTMANILIGRTVNGTVNGEHIARPMRNYGTVNGRAASEPRIACRARSRAGPKRSRSLSPQLVK